MEIPAELWTSSRIDLELATAADALNQTVTAFNALRRAYRTVRKSSSAKTLFLRNREPRDG